MSNIFILLMLSTKKNKQNSFPNWTLNPHYVVLHFIGQIKIHIETFFVWFIRRQKVEKKLMKDTKSSKGLFCHPILFEPYGQISGIKRKKTQSIHFVSFYSKHFFSLYSISFSIVHKIFFSPFLLFFASSHNSSITFKINASWSYDFNLLFFYSFFLWCCEENSFFKIHHQTDFYSHIIFEIHERRWVNEKWMIGEKYIYH